MFPQVDYSFKPEFFSTFTESDYKREQPQRVKFNAIKMNHGDPTVKKMQSIIKDIKTRNRRINDDRHNTYEKVESLERQVNQWKIRHNLFNPVKM